MQSVNGVRPAAQHFENPAQQGHVAKERVEVISKIRFDNVVTKAMIEGVPVVEYAEGEIARQIEAIWKRASAFL